jgi:hypothetical protein
MPSLSLLTAVTDILSPGCNPSSTSMLPEPVVAIHVSEVTQSVEWFYTSWHYFVAYE